MNTLYLVRHGECETNAQDLVGTRDPSNGLTAKGRLQAAQAGQRLCALGVDELYSSTLTRARQTGEIIGGIIGRPNVALDEFVELDMGVLQGTPLDEPARKLLNQLHLDWYDGHHESKAPGGEDYTALWGRFQRGMEQVLAGKEDRRIVIIGHGRLFRSTIFDLCPDAQPDDIVGRRTPNGSISEVHVERHNGHWVGRLVRWCDGSHLSGAASEMSPS